ncbi:MAG: SMC family ATPase [Phycicoccus sp.]|uniref:AAA family ATPase n=1 Tax=Phycicoccus sp. TaxID=1902410 RepID=UPI0025841A7D|nr:SMC family ATPase [Phycicoccus sp.]MCO5301742.1 SMC family ATPase [Phycicoccus sp.]
MRIHLLEAEAFGPFPQRVRVDVDDLAAGGLFLIHGPTGAGKTSILDAVCYALFADLPGTRTKKGLRSDHAPADRVPEVVLEFTISGRRLRLTRSPEFARPRKRGTGTPVTVQARVRLDEFDGATWSTKSTRHDEVAEEIHDLVGMGLSQFAKVAVLPQGDFAAFLSASAEERRAVLERLFDIATFADVEAWLTEQRRESATRSQAARSELEAVLRRIEDALVTGGHSPQEGPSDTAVFFGDTDAPALTEALTTLGEEADRQLATALSVTDAATLAEQQAGATLAAARASAQLRDRGRWARSALAALDAALPAHAARMAEVEAARRAAGLAGHLAAVRRTEAEVERAATGLRASLTALTARGLPTEPETLDDVLRAARDLDPTARELQASLDGATSDDLTLQAARDAERTAAAAADERSHLVSAAQGRVDEVTRRLAAATEAEHDLTAVDRDLAAARDQQTLLVANVADHDTRSGLVEQRRGARDHAHDARTAHADLRDRQFEGRAAQLAAALVDGSPCAVCGAVEHPAPASDADPVSDVELSGAAMAADEAQAQVAALDVRIAAIEAAIATREAQLDGQDVATVDARLAELTQRRARVLAAHDRLAALRAEAADSTTALVLASEEHQQAQKAHAAALALLERAREAQARHRTTVERLTGEHQGCPCRPDGVERWTIEHHDGVCALLQAALRARETLRTAGDAHRAATDAATEALAEAGFENASDAAAAHLSADALASRLDAIREHEERRVAARTTLTDPGVSAAMADPPVDLEAIAAAHESARVALAAATRDQVDAERTVAALRRLTPSAITAAAARDATVARHDRVQALADLATGVGADNTLRMRLTAYVLAARLERVVAFANDRLGSLGAGRYLLEHTDTRSGQGRSGLGLRVLDQWTGQARETSSLSGGETFMASLALALGLADAVRSELGGRDLGTLFVDEGFGTLDDESLEDVMALLDGLQSGGRIVGIVSHVADLRARIPHQLVVTKTPDGSTVDVVRDDALHRTA